MTRDNGLNNLHGYPVPLGHFVAVDTGTLYARHGRIERPEEYLARYYDRDYALELAPRRG